MKTLRGAKPILLTAILCLAALLSYTAGVNAGTRSNAVRTAELPAADLVVESAPVAASPATRPTASPVSTRQSSAAGAEPIQPVSLLLTESNGEAPCPEKVEQALLALGCDYPEEGGGLRVNGDIGIIKGRDWDSPAALDAFQLTLWLDAASGAGLIESVSLNDDPCTQFPGGYGGVYLQEEAEALIARHFGLDATLLRELSHAHCAVHGGYHPGGYCGTTSYPAVKVVAVEQQGERLTVAFDLVEPGQTRRRELVLTLLEDGWRYESYQTL